MWVSECMSNDVHLIIGHTSWWDKMYGAICMRKQKVLGLCASMILTFILIIKYVALIIGTMYISH